MKKTLKTTYSLLSAVVIIGLATFLAKAMYDGASKLPVRQYFPRSSVNAVWDWSNVTGKTQADLNDLSNFMYLHQLNAVYVNADFYTHDNPPEEFDQAMYQYVKVLKKHDVRVFAAGGDVTWSNREEWDKPLAMLKAVSRYNQRHPDAKLAGVEFDIESYNQPGFAEGSPTTKTLTLTDYLDLVDKLATETAQYNKKGAGLEIGFAIPYWFDNQNGNIPSVTWRGKTGPTLYHLLDRLNSLERSNVVVMAYRNVARGNDGVIAHARTEVDYARSKAPNVSVIIGQELGDVEPAKITYFGQTTTELSVQVKIINEEFKDIAVMRGIALNDLASFQAMEE